MAFSSEVDTAAAGPIAVRLLPQFSKLFYETHPIVYVEDGFARTGQSILSVTNSKIVPPGRHSITSTRISCMRCANTYTRRVTKRPCGSAAPRCWLKPHAYSWISASTQKQRAGNSASTPSPAPMNITLR